MLSTPTASRQKELENKRRTQAGNATGASHAIKDRQITSCLSTLHESALQDNARLVAAENAYYLCADVRSALVALRHVASVRRDISTSTFPKGPMVA